MNITNTALQCVKHFTLQYREIACCRCGLAGHVAGTALGDASGLLAGCDTVMPDC